MPKIFISHSSKDNVFAEKLALSLREHGAEVWLDLSDIPAGMKWSAAIHQGLNWAELMILIVTPDSMASDNVADEWEYYHQKKKKILPVWWIPAEMHFQLNRFQYVDFHGRDFDTALTKLSAELTRIGFPLLTPPPTPVGTTLASSAESTSSVPASSRPVIKLLVDQKPPPRTFPLILKPDWVGRGKLLPDPFEWCIVPEGKVTLEPSADDEDDDGYLKKEQAFDVPEFKIARYPITNAQFDVFVTAADGWRDEQWWDYSSDAKKWRKNNRQCEVAQFKDCPDCPRETVTWYAAIAFTRWLSAKTDRKVTLPTEQQWQRAAQDDDGRIYPWGHEWNGSLCNNLIMSFEAVGTTPVTHYLGGASPYGAIDMAGNLWEWCSTDFKAGSNKSLIGNNSRILRGGSWWNNDDQLLKVAYRIKRPPGVWINDGGFRLVSSAQPTHHPHR